MQKLAVTNANLYLKIISVFFVNPSGMVCIQDDASSADQEAVKKRLASLSSFQLKCLNHGLRFPRLKRLVYSTCSIHSQENEEVVAAGLQQNPAFRWWHVVYLCILLLGLFQTLCLFLLLLSSRLVPLIPQWPERGQEPLTQCLRASVAKTRTHGFFVALFERSAETVNKQLEPVPVPEKRCELRGILEINKFILISLFCQ